jgi:hypothetical protein
MILKMVIIRFLHIIAASMCIMAIMHIIAIISIISDCFLVGWLESVGSHVVYELHYKKPIIYAIPIESILGKLPLVPVDRYYPAQHAQRLFGRSRRPEAGRRRWMPNVVRQLMGIGMVP